MIKSTDSLKNPHEAKYWLLIIKDESVHWKHCNDPKAFIWYFNEMDDIYENIEENIKKLIVFVISLLIALVTKYFNQ